MSAGCAQLAQASQSPPASPASTHSILAQPGPAANCQPARPVFTDQAHFPIAVLQWTVDLFFRVFVQGGTCPVTNGLWGWRSRVRRWRKIDEKLLLSASEPTCNSPSLPKDKIQEKLSQDDLKRKLGASRRCLGRVRLASLARGEPRGQPIQTQWAQHAKPVPVGVPECSAAPS